MYTHQAALCAKAVSASFIKPTNVMRCSHAHSRCLKVALLRIIYLGTPAFSLHSFMLSTKACRSKLPPAALTLPASASTCISNVVAGPPYQNIFKHAVHTCFSFQVMMGGKVDDAVVDRLLHCFEVYNDGLVTFPQLDLPFTGGRIGTAGQPLPQHDVT
jgi:hypothetical protein